MKKIRYQLMIIASALMFGIAPVLTASTYQYGGNGISMPFYMSVISLPLYILLLRMEKTSVRIDAKTFGKMVILSVGGSTSASIMLMYSYSLIPVGMATTLHFVYPVVVAFGLVLFFKEKLNLIKIAALAVAVGGIAVMSLEGGDMNVLGILLALGSGVLWAFYIVYLDKSGLSALSAYFIGFYTSVITIAEAGILGLATGNLRLFTSWKGWAFAVGATLLARVMGQTLFQLGIRGAGSLAAGILSTFEPITSVIIGILFLGEGSSLGKLLGCAMVIVGVCLIVVADYREEAAARNRQKVITDPHSPSSTK